MPSPSKIAPISDSVLPPRHAIALKAYVRTNSFTAAGIAAGVSRQSVKKWSESPAWREALAQISAAILPRQARHEFPKRLFEGAMKRLAFDLLNGTEEQKSRSARLIFSRLSGVMLNDSASEEIKQLAQRIESLQEMIDLPDDPQSEESDFEFDDEDSDDGE